MAEDIKDRSTTPAPTSQTEGPMADLRRQVDQLFDDFTHAFRFPTSFGFGLGTPSAPPTSASEMADVRFEVSETPEAMEVTAEIPGMSEDDLDVDLTNDILTIRGEKKAESEKKEKNYYFSERCYGHFHRSFRLPETIDRDKIDAQFDKGVLTVKLPKRPEAKSESRKIKLK